MRFTGAFRANQQVAERVMDSEDLERERGITIHAKDTSIEFEGVRIHLVDTPGHADFGGEVERVLSMVDAVLLVVDSVDGVMPQTRFVVGKALAHGLRPLLVVNKVDRPGHRAEAVVDEVFDLLVDLGADDEQLDFPVVFASAKEGTAVLDLAQPRVDLRPLLETMVSRVRAPAVDLDGPLQFQAVTLDYDDYLGRLVIGRVARGRLVRGASVVRVGRDGATERFRVTKLLGARGLERVELDEVGAGELGVLAGVDSIEIGDTICDPDVLEALPRIHVDPPTVRVHFSANTSPLAGREGRFVTSRQIDERLRTRGARQRGDLGGGVGSARDVPGGRPRRAPARDPDRDDAPRGLRVQRLAPGDHRARDRRPALRAGRRRGDRGARHAPRAR